MPKVPWQANIVLVRVRVDAPDDVDALAATLSEEIVPDWGAVRGKSATGCESDGEAERLEGGVVFDQTIEALDAIVTVSPSVGIAQVVVIAQLRTTTVCNVLDVARDPDEDRNTAVPLSEVRRKPDVVLLVIDLNHVELSWREAGRKGLLSFTPKPTEGTKGREGRGNPPALDFCERESDEIIDDRRRVPFGRRRVELGRDTNSVEGEVLETCENAATISSGCKRGGAERTGEFFHVRLGKIRTLAPRIPNLEAKFRQVRHLRHHLEKAVTTWTWVHVATRAYVAHLEDADVLSEGGKGRKDTGIAVLDRENLPQQRLSDRAKLLRGETALAEDLPALLASGDVVGRRGREFENLGDELVRKCRRHGGEGRGSWEEGYEATGSRQQALRALKRGTTHLDEEMSALRPATTRAWGGEGVAWRGSLRFY
jgi:hypothetical protein